MASCSSPDLSGIRLGFVDVLKPGQIMASAPSDRNLKIVKEKGIQTTHDNCEVVRSCNVVILACKPYHIEQVSVEIKSEVNENKLVLSVLGGTPISRIEYGLPSNARVMRVLPNVASAVLEGYSVIVPGTNATRDDVTLVKALFTPIGMVHESTDNMSNVSATTGSCIAYMALVLEALSDGAVKMGMQRHVTTQMAAQIMMGTGKMQLETGLHPGQIKDSVCSPNGTTICGVHAMEKTGVRGAVMEAFEAAVKRAEEISK